MQLCSLILDDVTHNVSQWLYGSHDDHARFARYPQAEGLAAGREIDQAAGSESCSGANRSSATDGACIVS